tara:strand:+ start:320 stop:2293 length:1974 start_codon:yes stop_codon:yes gene_type:complete
MLVSGGSSEDMSVLILAKLKEWPRMLELLRTDPQQACISGSSGSLPLHFAVEFSAPHDVILELLKAYPAGVRTSDVFGMLPLHYAVSAKADMTVIRELLSVWPDAVSSADAHGTTPFEMISEYRQTDPWRAAVGAELPRRFTAGFHPPENAPSIFHRGALTQEGWSQALALLSTDKSCATVKDGERMLPIHWAALYSAPVDVVDALLAAFPTSAAAKCAHGRVPLHYAIIGRAAQDVVAALIIADPAAINIRSGGLVGGTPLQIAQGNTDDSVVSTGPPLSDAVLALLASPEHASLVPKVTTLHKAKATEPEETDANQAQDDQSAMTADLRELGVEATAAARAWCNDVGVEQLDDLVHADEAERSEFVETLALKPMRARKFMSDLSRRLAAQAPPPSLAHGAAGQLLIFACSPSHAPLANVVVEADDVMAQCDAVASSGSAERLRQTLVNMRPLRFLFAGHADAKLNGERTLAFTDDAGRLSVAQPDALASMLRSVRQDRPDVLELVFLNGCSSEALGHAVHEQAGVPWVVCWRTPCNDEAARFFSVKFFQALNRATYRDAFEQAKSALQLHTRPGRLANGVSAQVPKFVLRDPSARMPPTRDFDTTAFHAGEEDEQAGAPAAGVPDAPPLARPTQATPAPIAAGLPLLLHDGGHLT